VPNEVPFLVRGISRRRFLACMGWAAAGLAAGCAANPVTGKSQLMLLSEGDEIRIDRTNSPHQFSADYGITRDRAVRDYVQETGRGMGPFTHRPHMPYSFNCVNAPYVNAYAFPGGTIACTRGILLELDNEAELAALLGHELGHVNARHTASQMSKGMLTSAAVGGLGALASVGDRGLGQLVSGIAGIGAGALLARYSRDNEREADSLSLSYMTAAGYNPGGMVGLMEMLQEKSRQKAGALELMFATHPMSRERYARMRDEAAARYGDFRGNPFHRERYMDRTASLRSIEGAVKALQAGDKAMAQKDLSGAEEQYRKALSIAPEDYAALVKMAECKFARKQFDEAKAYSAQARQVYPDEARATMVSGLSRLMRRDFDGAYRELTLYGERLPGNPGIVFLRGFTMEGMGRRQDAARLYYEYLQAVDSGDQARYAYQRLVEWGYVKQ